MMLAPEVFLTKTMREKPWGNTVARILAASLAAVEPGNLMHRVMQRDKSLLTIDDITLDLDEYRQIIIFGIGKASIPMSAAGAEILGDYLTSGIILTKTHSGKKQNPDDKINIFIGGHPIPDRGSLEGAKQILNMTKDLTAQDLVLVLLSGGGSSLLTAPFPGISLEDLQRTNQVLLGSGADILDINTVRKHISLVKGGQLAKAIHPARLVTLILSDVVTNSKDLYNSADMVASGPTMADPSTFQDAIDVINFYQIKEQLPTSVVDHLESGNKDKKLETPKPGDNIFKQITTVILGGNTTAVEAGIQKAKEEGFNTKRAGFISGDAKQFGSGLAEMMGVIISGQVPEPFLRPSCNILGGESTVTLPTTGKVGKGGRNQEVALSAMPGLAGLKDIALITLASDGEDGITGAAGAVVTGDSYQRAQDLGMNPEQELVDHNSYSVFAKLDDLIITGSTFTNVNDLCFIFYF